MIHRCLLQLIQIQNITQRFPGLYPVDDLFFIFNSTTSRTAESRMIPFAPLRFASIATISPQNAVSFELWVSTMRTSPVWNIVFCDQP